MDPPKRKSTARSAGSDLIHTNFEAAFSPGHVFRASDGKIRVRQEEIAKLVLTSGRIIAADPSSIQWKGNQRPFSRRVPPGKYAVRLALGQFGNFERPACLMLCLKKTKPVQWDLALLPGQKLNRLKPGQIFGYGVDAGMGCFVDARAALRKVRESDWFEDVYWKQLLPIMSEKKWGEIPLDQTGANLVACTSGYGDGVYASYWGIDRIGDAACLVTDFSVLVESVDHELIVDDPIAKVGTTLQHPKLDEAGLRVRIVLGRIGSRVLRVHIQGRSSCRVGLLFGRETDFTSMVQQGEDEVLCDLAPKKALTPDCRLLLKFNTGVRAL